MVLSTIQPHSDGTLAARFVVHGVRQQLAVDVGAAVVQRGVARRDGRRRGARPSPLGARRLGRDRIASAGPAHGAARRAASGCYCVGQGASWAARRSQCARCAPGAAPRARCARCSAARSCAASASHFSPVAARTMAQTRLSPPALLLLLPAPPLPAPLPSSSCVSLRQAPTAPRRAKRPSLDCPFAAGTRDLSLSRDGRRRSTLALRRRNARLVLIGGTPLRVARKVEQTLVLRTQLPQRVVVHARRLALLAPVPEVALPSSVRGFAAPTTFAELYPNSRPTTATTPWRTSGVAVCSCRRARCSPARPLRFRRKVQRLSSSEIFATDEKVDHRSCEGQEPNLVGRVSPSGAMRNVPRMGRVRACRYLCHAVARQESPWMQRCCGHGCARRLPLFRAPARIPYGGSHTMLSTSGVGGVRLDSAAPSLPSTRRGAHYRHRRWMHLQNLPG